MTSADYDVAFITPVMVYAVHNPSDEQRRRQASGVASGPGPAAIDPLEDFSNWSGYVADVPPVLLIRVSPRLVEGFWTKVARGAASTQGVSLPPNQALQVGVRAPARLLRRRRGAPVHPFRLEQRVSETDAVYEGLYAFDPGALAPSCGTVKLTFYSEKEPEKGDTKVVDAKICSRSGTTSNRIGLEVRLWLPASAGRLRCRTYDSTHAAFPLKPEPRRTRTRDYRLLRTTISRKPCTSRLAPPTSAPLTSSCTISEWMLSGLTLPP